MTSIPAGPARSPHARSIALPTTASSWRTCPKVNARKNVPNVEGAITRCPNTAPVDPAHQADRRVDQRLEPQLGDERRGQDQPRIGDQRLVIEHHPDAVDPMIDCAHWKCLPTW